MFHKLRLKLTLINAFIMFSLFGLLIVGVYFSSQFDMNRRADFMAQKIINDIRGGWLTDVPTLAKHISPVLPGPPPGSFFSNLLLPPPDEMAPEAGGFPHERSFFLIKSDAAGKIIFQSVGALQPEKLAGLVEAVTASSAEHDMIIFDQTPYSYWKAALGGQGDQQATGLILFHDLSQEQHLQRILLVALLAVGTVCSILSFGASFFMANRAMVPITNAWQQQKDFLSDASHELRTPLTIIQTNLEIVQRMSEATVLSQKKWLDNIQEECIAMAELVESLLFIARADSQQQVLDCEKFDLRGAVIRAATPFESISAATGVFFAIHADLAVYSYGDERRIRQVIAILLDNAFRHTATGKNVVISLQRVDQKAVVTVEDTGEGIAAEYLDKIFNRFYQVDKSRSRGGAGLGLAIAKLIVETQGGEITVDSEWGAGTTFTIVMPLYHS